MMPSRGSTSRLVRSRSGVGLLFLCVGADLAQEFDGGVHHQADEHRKGSQSGHVDDGGDARDQDERGETDRAGQHVERGAQVPAGDVVVKWHSGLTLKGAVAAFLLKARWRVN